MIITIFDESDNEIDVKIYFNTWDEITFDETSHSHKQVKIIEKYLRENRYETEILLWKYIENKPKEWQMTVKHFKNNTNEN